jgi:hypothetical protein
MANIPDLNLSNYHLKDIESMVELHTLVFSKVKSAYPTATQTELINITNSLTSSFLINHAISLIDLNMGDMESYLYGIQKAIDGISI